MQSDPDELSFLEKVCFVLLSMTGFGHSSQQLHEVQVSTEIKSVNNRYLKLALRLPDTIARFEADIEKLVRARVSRGTVQLSFRVRFGSGQSEYRIDTDVLRGYQQQLSVLGGVGGAQASSVPLSELLGLPGVVAQLQFSDEELGTIWPAVESSLKDALDHFDDFRRREGESMRKDLQHQCEVIETEVSRIATLAPGVVTDQRDRILERVRRLISETTATIVENDLIREVAMFADRCDVNEEITRLRSHTEQFQRLLNGETSQGRKLEFIGQEMFREINTIGSKANNVAIALGVVEMKAAIERMREVLQNVE